MGAADYQRKLKVWEKDLLGYVRGIAPELVPAGALEQPNPPAPDILIRTSDGALGIEISQIFPMAEAGGFDPAAIEKARENAIR